MDTSTASVSCPYCWERIDLDIDPSVDHQQYIEDCPVCCRPMNVDAYSEGGEVRAQVSPGNE